MTRRQGQQKQSSIPLSLFSPNPFTFNRCVLVTFEGVRSALSEGKIAAVINSYNVSDGTSRINHAGGLGTAASDESRNADTRHGGSSPAEASLEPSETSVAASSGRGLTCGLCKEAFASVAEQRAHFKSDWHKFNVKRKASGRSSLTAEQLAERMEGRHGGQREGGRGASGSGGVEDSKASSSAKGDDGDDGDDDGDLSSISGSEDEAEEDGTEGDGKGEGRRGGAVSSSGGSVGPKVFFFLPRTKQLFSIWRVLLSGTPLPGMTQEQHMLCLLACLERHSGGSKSNNRTGSNGIGASMSGSGDSGSGSGPSSIGGGDSRCWVVLLSSGGHFAAAVFEAEDGGRVVAHQTFHRYVVRAKAGGRQSTRDASGRAPSSAGASLRRYNEGALTKDIRALLAAWEPFLSSAQFIFVHAPSANRPALFGTAADHSRCAFITHTRKGLTHTAAVAAAAAAAAAPRADDPSAAATLPTTATAQQTGSRSHVQGGEDGGGLHSEGPATSPAAQVAGVSISGGGGNVAVGQAGRDGGEEGVRKAGAPGGSGGGGGGRVVLLSSKDERIRRVPFPTRRPTLKEAKRVAEQLARTDVQVVTGEGAAAVTQQGKARNGTGEDGAMGVNGAGSAAAAPVSIIPDVSLSIDSSGSPTSGAALQSHVTQVRGGDGGPEVGSEVDEDVGVSGGCVAADGDDAAASGVLDAVRVSTALHLAAASGDAEGVVALLESGADPTVKDERGHVPYQLAGQKETRDAIRRFMATHESMWDWKAACVPSALTEEMEAVQAAKQAEKDARRKAKEKERKARRKAADKEKKEAAQQQQQQALAREQEQLVAAATTILTDREMRVAAAERRLKMLAGSTGGVTSGPTIAGAATVDAVNSAMANVAVAGAASCAEARGSISSSMGTANKVAGASCEVCQASLFGRTPFHRLSYSYCSTTCVRVHKAVLEEDT